ncbi:MAG: hypothetical protein UX92_C0024G0013 [Candidatus Amesbacteria bacterium GW2011_GWA1_47_20]|uniref:Uncharacterized protein n=1 Tax=Candidatus Amesbacteria bacterium GW2011_GWA1_47_20 TaxID=1618354 RepID=A0A0G1UPS3_9BACT|nr:MAG: hypothetical protein UX92_C0024G0013 [Candidatus Amesbacteria bacterium GW2011_GWA1_47_20]
MANASITPSFLFPIPQATVKTKASDKRPMTNISLHHTGGSFHTVNPTPIQARSAMIRLDMGLFFLVIAVIIAGFGITLFLLRQWLNQRPTQDPILTDWLKSTSSQLNDRLDNAARVISDVQKNLGEMSEVGRGIKSLQEFLQSPKLRGGIGEEVLKEMIGQTFPKNAFHLQYRFKTGGIVDAVLKTDAGLLCIDSKFPMENFNRMQCPRLSRVSKHFICSSPGLIAVFPGQRTGNQIPSSIPTSSRHSKRLFQSGRKPGRPRPPRHQFLQHHELCQPVLHRHGPKTLSNSNPQGTKRVGSAHFLVTTPTLASTTTMSPVFKIFVAFSVPTMQGISNSREMMAACEVIPPISVTIAAAFTI